MQIQLVNTQYQQKYQRLISYLFATTFAKTDYFLNPCTGYFTKAFYTEEERKLQAYSYTHKWAQVR